MAEVKRWRCKICGYIHEGSEPPEVCPLCCADKDQFEPMEGDVESSGTRWQCQVCGYIHTGDNPPASCPICGASVERFGQMRPEAW